MNCKHYRRDVNTDAGHSCAALNQSEVNLITGAVTAVLQDCRYMRRGASKVFIWEEAEGPCGPDAKLYEANISDDVGSMVRFQRVGDLDLTGGHQ